MHYPRFRVSGTPYERGRAYGGAARRLVERSVEAYTELFLTLTQWTWERVTNEALKYADCIRDGFPETLEEMRGIGEGSGVGFESILALNVRTEIMNRGYAAAAKVPPGECTALGIGANVSHGALLGQNYDWMPHCSETLVMLEVARSDGPSFATLTEAGILSKVGLNSAGLGIMVNSVYTEHDVGKIATPYHVLVRAVYDCETLDEVKDLVAETKRASSLNFVLGHASGEVLDVEASAGSTASLEVIEPTGGRVLHTNHFIGRHFADEDLSRQAIPDSTSRLERLTQLLDDAGPEVSPTKISRLLSDHKGFPTSICYHVETGSAPHDSFATVASVVIDLANSTLLLTSGQPCNVSSRTLDYRSFFSSGKMGGRPSLGTP